MKKADCYIREKMILTCETYDNALKDALLEKQIGEKVSLTAYLVFNDVVNGYVLEIVKVK